MKYLKRKMIAILMALCMLCTMGVPVFGAENTDASKLSNPKITKGRPAVWDCVWFGHYPQTSNGSGAFNNDPIKWRVLSVSGSKALLLADKNLDAKAYNEEPEDGEDTSEITWETSTVRAWLNGNGAGCFLKKAFTDEEQTAIFEQSIQNANNPEFKTPGGNTTKDKLFLLSIEEVMKPDYGFFKNIHQTKVREAVNTAYVASKADDYNMEDEGAVNAWWLRSPGCYSDFAANVWSRGDVNYSGSYIGSEEHAVRPALYLDLNSESWFYAGTVSSDGTVNEIDVDMANADQFPEKPVSPIEDVSTWDCVWFGHYPQTSNGSGNFNNAPIKWRVLSVKGNEALLLSEKILDGVSYNNATSSNTWDISTARSWLNGYGSNENEEKKNYAADNFIGKAFSSAEQAAIYETNLENPGNEETGEAGGKDTHDKIFFLSLAEATNEAYGFLSNDGMTGTRKTKSTDYAKSRFEKWGVELANMGMIIDCWWWLRTPGEPYNVAEVMNLGDIGTFEPFGCDYHNGVRPALRMNLESHTWSYAGTVSSDGTVDEIPSGEQPASLERITVSKSKKGYKVNETLNLDDLTVIAFYSDGASKAVTDYTTNAKTIDMSMPGSKNLTITYTEGSVTQTASLTITVEQQSSNPTPSTPVPGQDPATTGTTTAAQSQKEKTTANSLKKPKTVTLKKVTSPKKGKLKLTWKKDKSAAGYQAIVATDKKFKKNKKTATIKKNKTVTKTFTKLKSKKTYYAKIRAYKKSGKTKVYGAYSKVQKVKVK